MIIVMKQKAPLTAVENLETELNNRGFKVSRSQGESKVVLGLIGDTFKLDERDFLGNEWVEKVMRVQEPYKRASRSFHPQNSIIDVSGVKVGGKKLVVMAGPCSIETPEQIHTVAQAVKNSGASLLRGGAFKPRTSPYSFQGLREKGLDMLIEAAKDVQLPVVTELMSADKDWDLPGKEGGSDSDWGKKYAEFRFASCGRSSQCAGTVKARPLRYY